MHRYNGTMYYVHLTKCREGEPKQKDQLILSVFLNHVCKLTVTQSRVSPTGL